MITLRIKLLLKQKIIWIIPVLVIFFGYITYHWNYEILDIDALSPIGASDKFLISFTIGNNASLFLYPVFSMIPCAILYDKSTKQWITGVMQKRLFYKNYIGDLIASIFVSSILFVIGFGLYYIVLIATSAFPSRILPFYSFAPLFPQKLLQIPFTICLMYVVHTLVVSSTFCFLCFSTIIVTNNYPATIIAITSINYFSHCIISIPIIGKLTSYSIPFLLFEIASFTIDPLMHYCQILSMFFLSCILLFLQCYNHSFIFLLYNRK